MNLIKLVEIRGRGKQYNPETERCDTEYSLCEVYINPVYIKMVREDEPYIEIHRSGELIAGLSKEQSFSKLFLQSSSNSSMTISVVGDPETVIKKLRGFTSE